MKSKFPLICIITLCFLPLILNKIIWIEYYFDASLASYKLWFPHSYLLAFVFFRLYLPFSFGVWAKLLSKDVKTGVAFFLITIQTLIIALLQLQPLGFMTITYYGYCMLVLTCVLLINSIWPDKIYFVFFFAGYITLSLLFDEVYPFSRYPMYSSFINVANVFILRGNAGQFIPLNKYYRSSGAGLSHVYYSICTRRRYDANTNNSDTLQKIGREMLSYIRSGQIRQPVDDSISINKVSIRLINHQIISYEIPLYKAEAK